MGLFDIGSAVDPYKNYFDSGGTTTTGTTSTVVDKTPGKFWDTLGGIVDKVGGLFSKGDGTPAFDLSKIIKLPTVDVGPDPATKKTLNIVLIAGGALILIMLLFGGKRRGR